MKQAGRIGIHGMGLAGALLAHELARAGVPFFWSDEKTPNAASPMAPGIINPLAGRKFRVNSDYASSQATTLATIRAIEEETGSVFWHPLPLIRLIETPEQAEGLADRGTADQRWVGRLFGPGAHGPAIHDPFGSFETLQAGWLDVAGLARAVRDRFRDRAVETARLRVVTDQVVDCRGWRCALEPRWKHLPWKNARGEVIEIELEGELSRNLWNGGGWLQPLPGGRWRAGATYAWSGFEAPPNRIAQSELVAKLGRWLHLPYRILRQEAGVRAIVIDYRPVLGAHPTEPSEFIFSGLGSHGAIQAPPCARQLVAHLVEGAPLEPTMDVKRFSL